MTIAELRNSVRLNLRTENLPITDSHIEAFVLEAIADLSEEYDLLTDVYSFDSVRGFFEYPLPSEVKRVIYVFYAPSASATVNIQSGINNDIITTNENLKERGWNDKGVFRWKVNGRTYRAEYEIIDRNKMRFKPYVPPSGIEPPEMNNGNGIPTDEGDDGRSYDPNPIPSWDEESPDGGRTDNETTPSFLMQNNNTLIIYEEADLEQIHPSIPPETILGGKNYLGRQSVLPQSIHKVFSSHFDNRISVWFVANKSGHRNLKIYTIDRFVIPTQYNPDEFLIPRQLRLRRLITVIAVKRILLAFMGEEAQSWINMLTQEEIMLRKSIKPATWDISGLGGLDVIRVERGISRNG